MQNVFNGWLIWAHHSVLPFLNILHSIQSSYGLYILKMYNKIWLAKEFWKPLESSLPYSPISCRRNQSCIYSLPLTRFLNQDVNDVGSRFITIHRLLHVKRPMLPQPWSQFGWGPIKRSVCASLIRFWWVLQGKYQTLTTGDEDGFTLIVKQFFQSATS